MKALIKHSILLAMEEEGATAAEYAVLLAVIVAAVAAAIVAFNLDGLYDFLHHKVLGCAGISGESC